MAVARAHRLLVVLVATAACRGATPPVTQRLVDLYKPELVADRVAPEPAPPRLEWRFDGKAEKPAALNAVADLAVKEGKLAGRTTDVFPMLDFVLPKPIEDADPMHEIEVRMRVDVGGNVSATLARAEKVDAKEMIEITKAFAWFFTS